MLFDENKKQNAIKTATGFLTKIFILHTAMVSIISVTMVVRDPNRAISFGMSISPSIDKMDPAE